MTAQDESEVDPAEPDGDVVEGKRISVSPVTGAVYLVTRWVEAGDDGKMRAIEKRELEDHEISALSDDARAFIEEKREEGLGYDEDELVTDGGVSRDDLKECWCCDGLHDSPGTLCPNCDEAGCNRFTDECASDHKPALTDGGVDQSEAAISHEFDHEDCAKCGGPIDPTEPGHYKSADDETFVHSVCFEEGEPSKVLDLIDEHPFKRQGARQYGCGHYAHGPPADLPDECPECEVPAP